MSTEGVGRTIVSLLRLHPRTAKLSQKQQAGLLGIDKSALSRWKLGAEPKANNQARAASLLGISEVDLRRPFEDIEVIVRNSGHSDWSKAEWAITSRFVDRWRDQWSSTLDELLGTHLVYLRIPQRDKEDLISSSLLVVSEIALQRGIKFSILNVDNRDKGTGSEIIYTYDGLAFPVADAIFMIGERTDGCEPLAIVLDRPYQRQPLSGFLVAIGVAAGRHYPMSRRVAVVPKSKKIMTLAELRPELGIFELSEAPELARQHTASFE